MRKNYNVNLLDTITSDALCHIWLRNLASHTVTLIRYYKGVILEGRVMWIVNSLWFYENAWFFLSPFSQKILIFSLLFKFEVKFVHNLSQRITLELSLLIYFNYWNSLLQAEWTIRMFLFLCRPLERPGMCHTSEP